MCSSEIDERYWYNWWIACGVGALESVVTWSTNMGNEEGVLEKISLNSKGAES